MTVFFDEARGRWRYDFQLAGVRHARECADADGRPVTSRRAAKDAEAEAKRQAKLAPSAINTTDLTFGEVMNDLAEGWINKTGWTDRRHMIRELLAFFGPATAMRNIDGARIQDYITFALCRPRRVWKGGPIVGGPSNPNAQRWTADPKGRMRSPSTVNRYLPLLRAAFHRAYNTRDPVTRERAVDEIPKIEKLPEPKRKARPVPEDVLRDILASLPDHVAEAVKATLYFGFRRTEIFSLTVSQVDFHARGIRLEAENVKNHEDAFIPGSESAMEFLKQLVKQAKTRNSIHLITWRQPFKDGGKLASASWRPIKSPKTAWRTAMKAIEVKTGRRWRWHDVRAAFITHVALTSGPLAAQAMARHRDFKTTQGYIEVSNQVTRAAADRVADRASLHPTKRKHDLRATK